MPGNPTESVPSVALGYSVPVPSLAAALVASIGSWMIDAMVESFLGFEGRIFLSLIDSAIIYFYARRWLLQLRDGS
jgi:hypothetical protein